MLQSHEGMKSFKEKLPASLLKFSKMFAKNYLEMSSKRVFK